MIGKNMINNMIVLSKVIGRSRKLAKLSQRELGDKLAISDKTISAYESGRAIPPVPTLKKIAEITKQPIDIFFQGDKKNDIILMNLKIDTILEKLNKIEKILSIK